MTLDRLHEFVNNLCTDRVIVQGRIIINDKVISTHYNKQHAVCNFFSLRERNEVAAALGEKLSIEDLYYSYDLDSVYISGGYDENNTHLEQDGDGCFTISYSITVELH